MSLGLSTRLKQFTKDGRHLNDDSQPSEEILRIALQDIIDYARELFTKIDGKLEHKKTITLYECQTYFQDAGGPPPNPENKNVCMKPDGGILILHHNNKAIPILIIEDKIQGTNDILFAEKKKKQATGNAIERGGKNIRGAEMLFANLPIFPYIMFASGCDFHSSETISKRIEMMNMGFPNHYIDISPTTTQEQIATRLNDICPTINIKKVCGKSVASVFVKAHKWNEMPHGSSAWKKEEIVIICKKVIDEVFISLTTSLKQETSSQ